MRAGFLTRGPTRSIDAEVALGSFLDRLAVVNVDDRQALWRIDSDHLYVLVRATICTGRTANTSLVVDCDSSRFGVASNCAGGTTNHANGVQTMHAGVGDHPLIVNFTGAIESRVVVMGGGARPNAIIAPSASIEIDDHGVRAVDESFFNQELKQPRIGLVFSGANPSFLSAITCGRCLGWFERWQWNGQLLLVKARKHDALDDVCGNAKYVNIPHSAQAENSCSRFASAGVVSQFSQAKRLSLA